MRQPDPGRQVPSGYRTPAGWAKVLRGSPATLSFAVLFWATGALTAEEAAGVAQTGTQRTRGVRTGDCA